MAASADQLASRLVGGGRAITRAERVGVSKACLAGKQVMVAAGVSAGLGPPGSRMSGVRGSGKWNVRYRVSGVQPVVGVLRYTGPVHLVNNPTRSHTIAPRRKKAMLFPDGGLVSSPVEHPGTRGKKFFDRAEPVVVAQSGRIVRQEVRSYLARNFAG